MGAWVRCSRGRVVYTGRITRPPFAEWTASAEGRATIELAASRIRFSLFGKTNAAHRRLWRALAHMARDRAVVSVIQRHCQAYFQRIGELASANVLPSVGMELHRLFVVPRVLLNGAVYDDLERELREEALFALLEGGNAVREFFVLRLIYEIEEAVVRMQPSPKHGLAAGEGWIIVGANSDFVWRLPALDDPPWHGHYYVLELTRSPVTRSVRKATGSTIEGLEVSLPPLSRIERNEILRRARINLGSQPAPHPSFAPSSPVWPLRD